MKKRNLSRKFKSGWKHLPYGAFKSGSSKIHPHNECGICGLDIVNKRRERREAKEEIYKDIDENMF